MAVKETPILTELATRPLHCVDVGARGGIPALWRPFANRLTVDAFEPDHSACEAQQRIAAANIHWHPIALGRRTGKQDFYLLNRPSGSSFYPPNEPVFSRFNIPSYYGIDRVLTIDVMGFSDFIRQHKRPLPELIKLDTQGSELDILASLEADHWADLLAVQSEVEFVEMYKGQPLFEDVDNFMKSKGFRLVDLRTHRAYRAGHGEYRHYLHRGLNFAYGSNQLSAELIAGDALYFRDIESANSLPRPTTLLRFLFVCLIYRYFDYALSLLDRAERETIISGDDCRVIRDQIRRQAVRPNLMQRTDWIGGLSRRLARRLGIQRGYQAFWMRRNWPDQ